MGDLNVVVVRQCEYASVEMVQGGERGSPSHHVRGEVPAAGHGGIGGSSAKGGARCALAQDGRTQR